MARGASSASLPRVMLRSVRSITPSSSCSPPSSKSAPLPFGPRNEMSLPRIAMSRRTTFMAGSAAANSSTALTSLLPSSSPLTMFAR